MDKDLKYTFDKNNEMIIDGCNTLQLAKKFGTPVYIVSESILRNRCELFSNILKDLYPNSIISYASKAFCCKAIYNLIKDYDFACDVVSGGEIYTASKAKFNPEKIFFHGNNKTLSEIKLAIKNKIYNFVVDNDGELEDLENLVKQNKGLENKINVIVRINPGIEAHTHEYIQTSKTDSKFGINVDSGEAEKFILKICQNTKLNFLGLHYHIGSQIFDTKPYALAAKKVMEFVAMLKKKHNIDVKLFNAGGGYGVWHTSKDPNLKDEDYKKFISVVVNEVKKGVSRDNLIEPTLVIEPGRSLICEAGFTLYTVGNVKEIKGVRKYVSIDGGMFENPRYALYQALYTAVKCKPEGLKQEKVAIVGKCCESGDCIIKDAKIEKLQKGDIVAILSTGAYNYSMASNYNRNPIPPVVMVNKGKARVVVKGQTYDDLIKFDM